MQWAARHFECPTCQARPKPKTVRPAAIPRTYQPCRVVGIDLVFLPEVGGEGAFPALSMVDWGSNYQMVERGQTSSQKPCGGPCGAHGQERSGCQRS